MSIYAKLPKMRLGLTMSNPHPVGSQIAAFWYEPSAQGWNRITRVVSAQYNFDLWENARLLALVNFALADAYIAHADTKFLYNFWRPVTAIRAGDTDGNPDTVADPAWISFLVAPAILDYPSGHSTAGGAASMALARFFGQDQIPFTTTSGPPFPGITQRRKTLTPAFSLEFTFLQRAQTDSGSVSRLVALSSTTLWTK
jgi:hypothetical protein